MKNRTERLVMRNEGRTPRTLYEAFGQDNYLIIDGEYFAPRISKRVRRLIWLTIFFNVLLAIYIILGKLL
jgi:hypothetical protein